LHRFPEAERSLRQAEGILRNKNTDTDSDLQLAWARLEVAMGHFDAAAARFSRSIEICERLYSQAITPATAWALTRSLSFAAEASPEFSRQRRERIAQVWADQNQRFPGHAYIQQQYAAASPVGR
jgi:hypothetical protein